MNRLNNQQRCGKWDTAMFLSILIVADAYNYCLAAITVICPVSPDHIKFPIFGKKIVKNIPSHRVSFQALHNLHADQFPCLLIGDLSVEFLLQLFLKAQLLLLIEGIIMGGGFLHRRHVILTVFNSKNLLLPSQNGNGRILKGHLDRLRVSV